MASNGIKNALLVLLIIFIVHLLILRSKLYHSPPSPALQLQAIDKVQATEAFSCDELKGPVKPSAETVDYPESTLNLPTKVNLKEMYDYVYSEDEEPADLSKFYEDSEPIILSDDIVCEAREGQAIACKEKAKPMIQLPVKEFAPMTEEKGNDTYVVINEYKNESILNGGSFGGTGIHGFETMSAQEFAAF